MTNKEPAEFKPNTSCELADGEIHFTKAVVKRVAFLTDTFHPQVNGLVTSIDSNRIELPGFGWEVLVFAPNLAGQNEEKNVFRMRGITYLPQPEYSLVLPWGKGFRLSGFGKFKCSLMHSHASYGAAIVGLVIAKIYGLPLVMTYHTLWEEYVHYVPLVPLRIVKWFNKVYSCWLCGRCALVIAPTEAIKKVLLGYGTQTKIEVLPSGLTSDVFILSGAGKEDFGAGKNTVLFSFAGRIGKEKRVDLLLKSLKAVESQLPPWHLCLAGEGPERKRMEMLTLSLGLRNRVTFLGYVSRSKCLDMMEASDLFIFPSPTETQGMVVIEAMGRSTPVLGVDAMGVGIMMKGERGGWLAKPDDEKDLAAKLLSVFKDKAAYNRKKAECAGVADIYRADVINSKLAGFYDRVIALESAKKAG